MSAFILPTNHIAALTSYANYQNILRQKPERVFEILTEENYCSVNYRYSENSKPAPADLIYRELPISWLKDTHISVKILKLANCYTYQSCETESWETSEAKAIIDEIVSEAIANLPGYDEADWVLK